MTLFTYRFVFIFFFWSIVYDFVKTSAITIRLIYVCVCFSDVVKGRCKRFITTVYVFLTSVKTPWRLSPRTQSFIWESLLFHDFITTFEYVYVYASQVFQVWKRSVVSWYVSREGCEWESISTHKPSFKTKVPWSKMDIDLPFHIVSQPWCTLILPRLYTCPVKGWIYCSLDFTFISFYFNSRI